MTQSPPDPHSTPPVLRAVPSDPTAAPAPANTAAARRRRAAQAAALQVAPQPQPQSPARPGAIPVSATPSAAQKVAAARFRPRHWGLILSFLLMVLLPAATATTYLYTRAANQYHSTTAFSIRSEEVSAAAAGILGAITQMGSGTASDINVLFDYIRSQKMVETAEAKLDLRAMFNRDQRDFVFALGDNPSIEHLLAYWRRMVMVDLSAAGIMEVRVNAFTPEDAHAIAEEILGESSKVVNQLSDQAHRDAIKYSRAELKLAENRLREVRQKLAAFRREHRMIDPSGDVKSQAGIVIALQSELARAMVDRDMLTSYADAKDQRVIQADRRIAAIKDRIEAERASVTDGGSLGGEGAALPDVVGDYEALRVDMQIASTAYTHTLAGLAAAEAQAQRQTRYLAPHIQPTMAEESLYPRRLLLATMTTLFLALGWSVMLLIYYNVRDNNNR